ncbi:citryl-CoA lyase [Sulfitobacter mediterraneus]|uniref:citryl-CoA lyase n=1 Tax=Sulfitobacter mediterraneus TaxID=83219 RepID=UPI0021A39B2D|nr:citryl-CoA lyase [Sulfitobacter mediterraneus]
MPMQDDVKKWWRTEIIEMHPGHIAMRGYSIEDLIENVSFVDMIWLMTRGDLPSCGERELLECALVSSVDHGPQAPSIAASRMAVTCGLGLNGALASAVNMLDDVHGGAGEQAVELFHSIDDYRQENHVSVEQAVAAIVPDWTEKNGKIIPGFGHRFHKDGDPRAPILLGCVEKAVEQGSVEGRFAKIAIALQGYIEEQKGTFLPLNIDGATAVIYAELGFAPALARGLFCLSRSVGILSHAWEQQQQGGRNKGPTPPAYRWKYDGKAPRRTSDTKGKSSS